MSFRFFSCCRVVSLGSFLVIAFVSIFSRAALANGPSLSIPKTEVEFGKGIRVNYTGSLSDRDRLILFPDEVASPRYIDDTAMCNSPSKIRGSLLASRRAKLEEGSVWFKKTKKLNPDNPAEFLPVGSYKVAVFKNLSNGCLSDISRFEVVSDTPVDNRPVLKVALFYRSDPSNSPATLEEKSFAQNAAVQIQNAFKNSNINVQADVALRAFSASLADQVLSSNNSLSTFRQIVGGLSSSEGKADNEFAMFVTKRRPADAVARGWAGVGYVPPRATAQCQSNPTGGGCNEPARYRSFVRFAAYSISTTGSSFVAPHELGHNLGLHHGNSSSELGFLRDYGRGFREGDDGVVSGNTSPGYRPKNSIMRYQTSRYQRVNLYSAPSPADPATDVLGTATRNSVKALEETAIPWITTISP